MWGAMAALAVGSATMNLPENYVAGKMVTLNDCGAWSWFMDPRCIVHDGKLIVGSVRAVNAFDTGKDDPNWGNVEVSSLDLKTGRTGKTVLHPHFEQDDHDGPAFLVLPSKRILALYTRHAVERKVYWRVSEPNDPLKWGEEKSLETPGGDKTYGGDNATYSNPFRLPDGRIINLYRGIGHEPNYLLSEDDGQSWKYGGHVLKGKGGYSPYPKYAYDGKGAIHMIVTEDHPRNYDNSIYHATIKDGVVRHSDGREVGTLSTTTEAGFAAWDLTRVFQGDPDNVAWTTDIELDSRDRPYIVFSVQKDGRGLRPRQGGMDHRYYYGRWDGKQWNVHEMAYAGQRLYPFEDDYTGLAALDPHNPDVVYISTNADPKTGAPLISRADGKRHYELFRGITRDSGANWTWEPITANSTTDNLRPLVPKWKDKRTALVWMRGTYRNNHGEWDTAVIATILKDRPR